MSRHSESVKRSIVERYLSGEESYASAGAIDGVDAATVRKWVAVPGARRWRAVGQIQPLRRGVQAVGA